METRTRRRTGSVDYGKFHITCFYCKNGTLPRQSKCNHDPYVELDFGEDEDESESSSVQDSDSEKEEEEIDDDSNRDLVEGAKQHLLDFFNNGTKSDLFAIKNCAEKRVQQLMEMRPYNDWEDLESKIKSNKKLGPERKEIKEGHGPELLRNAAGVFHGINFFRNLMEECENPSEKMKKSMLKLISGTSSKELKNQPIFIGDDHLKMTRYQMIGLNWLIRMNKKGLNGILADESGLGKTIQILAFLSHLKELGMEEPEPHLIIVQPNSILKWEKEISTWCPDLKFLRYDGSKEYRRQLRQKILQREVQFDIILTTIYKVISTADEREFFKKLEFHHMIFDEAHHVLLKNTGRSTYQNLMQIKTSRRLLVTGNLIEDKNDLEELLPMLEFVMPKIFEDKKSFLKEVLSMFPKARNGHHEDSKYKNEMINLAKGILIPFVLKRKKSNVQIQNELHVLPLSTKDVCKYFDLNDVDLDYQSLVNFDLFQRTYKCKLQDSNRAAGNQKLKMLLDAKWREFRLTGAGLTKSSKYYL